MDIYEYILVTTLGISLVSQARKTNSLPYFFPFILVVVLVELFIEMWYYKMYGTNFPVMNIYSKICLYYYLFVFYKYFERTKWSATLKWIIIFYIIITLLWNFAFHDATRIDYISYNVGYLILFPLMFLYLNKVIYEMEYFNVFLDPYFYFIFGILVFYTSSFPILGFINILITDNPTYPAYITLLNIGNIFLSLAYLGAALCSTIPKPSTTSS